MKNFCLTALLLGLSLCVAGVCAQTPAKNKASVLKAYDDLNNQNARTWGVLSANLIPLPDPIPYWPQRKGGSGGTLRAIELGFVEYFRSFPDAHWTVERATAEGNTVTVELLSSGTFKNKYMDWAATGRPFSFQSTQVFTFDAQGKLESGFPIADMTPYLR